MAWWKKSIQLCVHSTSSSETQISPFSVISSLVSANNDRLDVFGGSPVRHEKVDHALGFNEQVAAEEEDPEHHGEGQHAHDGYLNHARHEKVTLIQDGCLKAAIRDHRRGDVATLEETIATVGEQTGRLGVVECRVVHLLDKFRGNVNKKSLSGKGDLLQLL